MHASNGARAPTDSRTTKAGSQEQESFQSPPWRWFQDLPCSAEIPIRQKAFLRAPEQSKRLRIRWSDRITGLIVCPSSIYFTLLKTEREVSCSASTARRSFYLLWWSSTVQKTLFLFFPNIVRIVRAICPLPESNVFPRNTGLNRFLPSSGNISVSRRSPSSELGRLTLYKPSKVWLWRLYSLLHLDQVGLCRDALA